MDWLAALWDRGAPNRWVGGVVALTLAVVWALGTTILGYVAMGEDGIEPAGFFVVMGMFVLPTAAVVVGPVGLLDRRWTARGGMLAVATALLAVAWVFVAIGFAADHSLEEGVAVSSLLMILPTGLAGLLAAIHAVGAFGELRRAVHARREAWLVRLLDLRGWVRGEEVAARTGWGLERAEAVADAAGFDATVEGGGLRLDRRAQRQRERILAAVLARGQVRLDILATELDEGVEALRRRLAELQASGDLHGHLHEGVLVSAELAALQALDACPGCGGALDVAGRGLVRCRHCDTTVYL